MRPRLRLSEIHGHVTATPTTLTAWYVLGGQRWSFTSDAQRMALIDGAAQVYAALAGRKAHLLVTTKPYPAAEWAQALHAATRDPLPGWGDHLAAEQRALRSASLAEKVVMLGVDVADRSRYSRLLGSAIGGRRGIRSQIELLAPDLTRLTDTLAAPGMDARPATTAEVEWLVHRMVRLGLPAVTVTGADAPEDLPAFTDAVDYTCARFAPTTTVSADYAGQTITRHVAVLSVGRMEPLRLPQVDRDPWLQATDRFGYPVDWSCRFTVLSGEDVRKATARARLSIRDMRRQYADHDMDEPLDLERKAEHARRIEDETGERPPVIAARVHGWHRLAVSGATEEECVSRVREVTAWYRQHGIALQHPRSLLDAATQSALLREFVPGEPLASTAYLRRLPVRYFAAGLPHVTAHVGDRRGPRLGYTCGSSRRSVTFDPHYAMEVDESSGLVPVVGGLGSGKSVLIGKAAYESTRRGIVTTILDPSGPLARLTGLPELAGHARHVDLADGADGILNPYAVVPDPDPSQHPTADATLDAAQIARQTRKALVTDVLRMLLPPQVDAMSRTPLVLADAVRAVEPTRRATLWQVVDALAASKHEHGATLAAYLRDIAEMPQTRLFFPPLDRDADETVTDTLLVLTMQGLVLPAPGQKREHWSTAEQVSVPLLHLASHYTTARAYGLPRAERKMIGLDEAGKVGQWGSGRALFVNLGRDSRKHNVSAWVASQDPADVLGMDVANWTSTTFVGRIEDEPVARDALRLLRVETGVGYEQVLGGLSPRAATGNGRSRGAREFLMRDVEGHVEKIRVEFSHQPGLLNALDSTPDGGRSPVPLVGVTVP